MLNTLLFVDMTIIVFTGLMTSEVVVPMLGIAVAQGGMWKFLHTQSANLAVFTIGLHVALHWSWIVNAISRYAVKPVWTGISHAWTTPTAKQLSKGV